jgi:PAS domain S-box-containing protein
MDEMELRVGPARRAMRESANPRARTIWAADESEELLRLAVQVGGIGIYDTDFEKDRTRFSPELCAILGLPVGTEMTYGEASRLFDERDRAAVSASVEVAGNSIDKGKWSGEHRIVRADGVVRWVFIHGRRSYRETANGCEPVRSIGTVIDITHLKETEAALRQSELRLRLALEAAQMGTFEADLSGSEAVIDAQEARLLGLPAKTRVVSADELRARIPLEDLHASDAKKMRLQQRDEAYDHEFRLSMPDGSERWLSAHAAIKSNRIFGVNFDVTRRKRAELALKESEARLRVAVSGAALGVFEWDARADRAVWENDRMYDIFGHGRGDGTLSKRRFVDKYLHPDDADAFEAGLNEALRTGGNFHAICRFVRKGGSRRWLQIDGRFERDATGERSRLVGVAADITERKTLEQEAEELSERLVTLQEEERQRIAQELHDSTAQHLVAVSLNLMSLRAKSDLESSGATLWNEVEASMEEALKELRTFSYLMNPPTLRADGLRSTIRQYINGYSNRSGLDVKLRASSKVDKLPFRMQRSLLRVVQEALANVHRHASASRASVDLRWIANRVHLIITDDGRGIAGEPAHGESRPFRAGIGILGIRARMRQFGGALKIRTGPRGTTIHAVVPLGHVRLKTWSEK